MAFTRWNKTPSKTPPEKSWSKDEMKTIGWCLNKNTYTDPNTYEDETVLNKIYEYYKYYYDKYNI